MYRLNSRPSRKSNLQSRLRAAIESLENRTLLSTVFDAAAGFSTTHNPNGPWAYGYSTAQPYEPMTPLTLYNTESSSGSGTTATWASTPVGAPAVFKNLLSTTNSNGPVKLPPDQLGFTPGLVNSNEFSEIRFTAPAAATYTAAVNFFGLSAAGTATSVFVLYNGQFLVDELVSGSGSGSAVGNSFTFTNVAKGATIDFLVGDGTDVKGNAVIGVTGVNATVTEVSPASTGTVTGVVFHDANGNGVQNTGETGLAGVQVYADLDNVGYFAGGDPTATTNATGAYALAGLPAGNYVIRQVPPVGDAQTAPANGAGRYVTVSAAQTLSAQNFGDNQAVLPTGTVTHTISALIDGRSDLVIQGSEVQWHHFDFNAPGVQGSPPITPTMIDGKNWFPSWPNGTASGAFSTVYPNLTPGLPTSGIVTVTLGIISARESVSILQQPTASNGDALIVEFNDDGFNSAATYTITLTYTVPPPLTTGSIAGSVFKDSNGDGVRQTAESTLAGWTAYADLNNNGKLDAGEPSAISDSTGRYTLGGLEPGGYVIHIVAKTGYKQTTSAIVATTTVAAGQTAAGPAFGEVPIGPFSGTPVPFELIQAENFDLGGQNTGYFNPTNINRGGLYRPAEGEGIGAIPTTDGGGNFVGWTLPGEYLNYSVSVASAGTYTLDFRVASQSGGGTFHLNVDGKNVTGELSVPSTGDWNIYTVVSKTGVNLSAGKHELQLVIDTDRPEVGAAGNFDWIEASKSGPLNLLVNGDFSQGATGFTSQYRNAPIAGGGYVVATDPTKVFDGTWLHIGDHTTGTGNMLLVDASTTANTYLWQETVNVATGTNYTFTGWAADMHIVDDLTNVPTMAVYVNNVRIGIPYVVPFNPNAIWSSFAANWNSGASKTATIEIIDLDTTFAGNDFALDDLSFTVK